MLARGDGRAAGAAYRFFDERGDLLALRSDMTIPIARLVATRFAERRAPLRLCYLAHAYRAVRPQRGQLREFPQAGVELIGAQAPGRDGRGDRGARRGARRGRPDRRGDRARRRRPLPPAARRARASRARRATPILAASRRTTSSASRPSSPSSTGSAPSRSRPASRSRSCAAAARCSTAPSSSAATRRAGRRAARRDLRGARGARGRRPGPDRPRPAARPRLLHRRDLRGLRPRARPRARRRRPLRRAAGRFGADLPAAGFALFLERLHVAQAEEEAAEIRSDGSPEPAAPRRRGR